jgi:hypothetical protein
VFGAEEGVVDDAHAFDAPEGLRRGEGGREGRKKMYSKRKTAEENRQRAFLPSLPSLLTLGWGLII